MWFLIQNWMFTYCVMRLCILIKSSVLTGFFGELLWQWKGVVLQPKCHVYVETKVPCSASIGTWLWAPHYRWAGVRMLASHVVSKETVFEGGYLLPVECKPGFPACTSWSHPRASLQSHECKSVGSPLSLHIGRDGGSQFFSVVCA